MYKLTFPSNRSFCEMIANNINKDYPGVAWIVWGVNSGYVALEHSYWQYTQEYVKEKCKIKK